MAKKEEKSLHQRICNFLDKEFPRVIYSVDPAGIRLSVGQASEVKRKRCKNWKNLDIPISHPSKHFHSLFLEVKKETPFKLNGELKADETIQEQAKTIQEHIRLGSYACFVWTYDQAVDIITKYFDNYDLRLIGLAEQEKTS